MDNRKKGSLAEDRAVEYLRSAGFEILERNFYASKFGEIDIIASKDGVIHFIEVKSSRNNFEPIYNLTSSKLRKIINSIYYYLDLKVLDVPFCVSIIIFRNDEVEFLENVTIQM